ncbi:Site-specific recombinase XerD [Parapedobacter composti]|uniref:Site-specific recombinase XerD n=1 Tax=Parapedobacter composti TaxID=623281 RepID=A0A1I1MIT6_9SPHI|nr:site-specific integrase [Parapedobacter composti]SFC85036.1 Site-specific recombinase XerD [Parapedobacter composti]
MSTNYSLLFYLKKPKNYVSGPVPIYMRITVDGIPKEVSIGRSVDPSRWRPKANRAAGTKEESRTLNSYLETLVRNIEDVHTALVKENAVITAESLKMRFLGQDTKRHYLIEIYLDHNRKMETLLGKGYKPGTLKGYKTSVGHLTDYVLKQYRDMDIDIQRIDHAFIEGYEFFLRTDKSCSPISAAKYMKHFRKIVKLGLAHRWITADPFVFYKNTAKPKEKGFLTQDELNRIMAKQYVTSRLAHVRDIFIFSCYTGLSYADVKKLKKSVIAKGVDGKLWILSNREKTETITNIPLLPQAKEIIDRYADYPPCVSKGLALPVLSNQKMNSYLKEIADLSGITKTLTFHMARHTFATTVTLSNDVPIETVSKMLGHTSIRTTQHYAKLLDTRIANDMQTLQRKLSGN